ncbi:MAG: hypothetical protein JXB62_15180 [Pirellulales bacterium]|nr:hypothetical protein [Pirellulales bacterium]
MDWRPSKRLRSALLAAVAALLFPAEAARGAGDESGSARREAATCDAVLHDWMLQDYMGIVLPDALEQQKQQWREAHLTARESKPDAPVLERLSCFVSDEDSLVERRMLDRVLEELGEAGKAIGTEAAALSAAGVPGEDPRWRQLYVQACELRRVQRLQPLLARWTRFVLSQHRHIPNTWKYTEALSDAQGFRLFSPGSCLEVLEMDGPYGRVRTLIEDPGGTLRNPDVSYDGKRMLFSWKKSDREDDFHLYEMDLATGQVAPLTEGPGVADYEGIYLPDGNILFNSTRCIQTVDCNWTEVSNFYLMDAAGRYMRRIGFDQVHTIFPTATDDGRVLYTRWDYNDRGQIFTQPLFEMNTDGTSQREFYGGNSWYPTNIIHARKIPGSRKVLAVVTGHHTPAHGKLAIVDPARGRQEQHGIQLIAPIRRTEPIRIDQYGLGGNQFQYPYPLDEQRFLVTLALPSPEGELGRFNVYLMDQHGRRELLVEGRESGEGIGCRQIVPLGPRSRPHVRPSQVDYRRTTGTFSVQDVYEGPGLQGIARGTVKRLRVVALKFRAAGIGRTSQQGEGGYSDVSTPIAVGNASWDVKVVLGTATVREDGSALFRVPARTPVYFQALDEKNRVVQTMRSWATLMPGEHQSCTGCHEHKNDTPRAQGGLALAARAGPEPLTAFHGPPRGFSFAKEIQPILDRRCLPCHAADRDAPCLSGETIVVESMKRRLSRSYLALTHTRGTNGDCNHPMVNWIDAMSGPAMLPPYSRGAATSRLMALLEEGHQGVRLSAEEKEKIACWIDLLVPYCGDYTEASVWSADEQERYARFAAKRKRQEELERANLRAWMDRSKTTVRHNPRLIAPRIEERNP